jgi:hypothetical protein
MIRNARNDQRKTYPRYGNWLIRLFFVTCLLQAVSVCSAQEGGGTVIRVPDGRQNSCINGQTDQVWLTLRRMIVTRRGGWLTEDSTVAVFATAALPNDKTDKPVKFPLMSQAQIQRYSKGQVSVPVEYALVQKFKLSQDSANYAGINVDLTLLNIRGRNKWGNTLNALSRFAQKLPVPANPYSKAVNYVLDFANSALTDDLNAQDKDDKTKTASIVLNFSPNGDCVGDFERTGTLAVLDEDGIRDDAGYVNIRDTNNYCWKADLKPSFVLYATPKLGDKACEEKAYESRWNPVANNYVGLFLNAVSAAERGSETVTARGEAIKRCEAHGIDAKTCLSSGTKTTTE